MATTTRTLKDMEKFMLELESILPVLNKLKKHIKIMRCHIAMQKKQKCYKND
jgi:hypothetical protein